ncbi:MAG: transporter [Pseudomonadota bacterium]
MARTLSYARAQLTTAATALLTLGLFTTTPATADPGHRNGLRADGHAPIGVMGDHMHKKGEFMFSYRFMRMDMEGSRIGTDGATPEEIATTVPNIFDINPGMPGVQPPFLRVVPTRMTMDMHMFGAMYAPTDNITLMVMLPYITKEMDHVTFQGPMGTNRLGTFTTKSEGIGDVKFGGLIRLYDDAIHHFHANLMFSAPTGSITEEDDVLTPFNTRPTLRLPYPMQLGTGTWDIHPGITYTARLGDLSWGGQYMAELRLESENDEGYSVGDKHKLTGWLAYQFVPEVSASVRLAYQTQDSIDGIDPQVTAPVQTANPDFQGGDRLDLLVGINSIVTQGALKGHRFAIEGGVPVYQDLNGPQMETDWLLTLGWQYAF